LLAVLSFTPVLIKKFTERPSALAGHESIMGIYSQIKIGKIIPNHEVEFPDLKQERR
jgi:hypothetical protein